MNPEIAPTVEAKVLDIIEGIADDVSEGSISKDTDLLVSGYLDSFGFVQLLMNLEKEFEIEIDEEVQLDPRLRSLAGIIDFVAGY